LELKRVVFLVVLGGLLSVATGFMGIAGVFSLTPFIVLIILVSVVVVLIVREFKQWMESLVEKITAGNRFDPSELTLTKESVASIRSGISRLEERLHALEKRGRG